MREGIGNYIVMGEEMKKYLRDAETEKELLTNIGFLIAKVYCVIDEVSREGRRNEGNREGSNS